MTATPSNRALGHELAHFLRRIDGGAGLELALDVSLERRS